MRIILWWTVFACHTERNSKWYPFLLTAYSWIHVDGVCASWTFLTLRIISHIVKIARLTWLAASTYQAKSFNAAVCNFWSIIRHFYKIIHPRFLLVVWTLGTKYRIPLLEIIDNSDLQHGLEFDCNKCHLSEIQNFNLHFVMVTGSVRGL